MTTLEIYTQLLHTIPLAPLSTIKKLTTSLWEKEIKRLPALFELRQKIESDKRDAKDRKGGGEAAKGWEAAGPARRPTPQRGGRSTPRRRARPPRTSSITDDPGLARTAPKDCMPCSVWSRLYGVQTTL